MDQLLELPDGTRFQVLAPVVRGRKGEFVDLFKELTAKGYSRARVDGELIQLSDPPKLGKQFKHTIEVVVDRLVVKEGISQRLTDSVETALGLAEGRVLAEFVDLDADDPERIRAFSEHLACPNEHPLAIDEIEPRSFSFNNPFGACSACSGIGTRLEVDEELIIPNPELSLAEGAIAPWSLGTATTEYWNRLLDGLAKELGFSMTTPWEKLDEDVRQTVLHGKDHKVVVQYRNRFGRERKYSTGFEGAIQYVHRKHGETDSDSARDRYEEYMRQIPCPACNGARLNPASLSVLINGKSIAEVAALPMRECAHFLDNLVLTGREAQIAHQVLKEIQARLTFLLDVGLEYLNLERPSGTLSGGEAQRIRLATQIGSGLVGVLYVLDEPSIGLHQRDNRRLIETLTRLRDLGNTLIVVEHDEDTIQEADWVVDIGPGAGEHGGMVVHSGSYKELLENTESLTGDYLSGRKKIEIPKKRRKYDKKRELKVVGAKENNLLNVDAAFPLGLFTAVTGVSGSGKSTLVNEILYKVLANKLNGAKQVAGRHKSIQGLEHLDKVVHVDQSPIGRTPRSNPATYTGVFDNIRKLFAETTEAKVRGYLPGRFSFNVKGGRCEACSGDGTLKIEMNFLPDVYVPCEVCHGARYNRETLEVHYKGKTIADVLNMPIEEGAEFFAAFSPIARHLEHARRRRPRLRPAGPARHHALRRRGAARQARRGTAEALQRPQRLRPGRAHHGPALRGHPQAAHGPPGPRGEGQHGHHHRAQPRRHQERGLDRGPWPRRRFRRRPDRRLRHPGTGGEVHGEPHGSLPRRDPGLSHAPVHPRTCRGCTGVPGGDIFPLGHASFWHPLTREKLSR